jgi:hypothetical protein
VVESLDPEQIDRLIKEETGGEPEMDLEQFKALMSKIVL